MIGLTGRLTTILAGSDPVGVVFYQDGASKEELVELCMLLAPTGRVPKRVHDVNEAVETDASTIVLLTPQGDQEADAVGVLDGRREALVDRTAPIIVFLAQKLRAEDALNESAPSLVNYLRGLIYDPEAPVAGDDDLRAERAKARAAFQEHHHATPEQWLEAWTRDELPDDTGNNFIAHQARLLAGSLESER